MSLLWKPLLAATLAMDAELSTLPYPLLASPKINGYRAMVQRGVVVTRKGLPFRNAGVQRAFGCKLFEGLDCEITVGPANAADVYNRTQNVVMSGAQEKEESGEYDTTFNIIDWFSGGVEGDDTLSFTQRNQMLKREFKGYKNMPVIKQTLIKNAVDLRAFEEQCLAAGYEGAMLRCCLQGHGAYPQLANKDNRSTLKDFILVKWKRVETGTAVILSPCYLEHNHNEEKTATGRKRGLRSGMEVDTKRVGSLTVEDVESKVTFSISVATNELRDKGMVWWRRQVGKHFTYKYTPQGRLTAPVHPRAGFEELL